MTAARMVVAIVALGAAALIALVASAGPVDIDVPVRTVERRLPGLRGLRFRRAPSVRFVSRSDVERVGGYDAVVKRLPRADRARLRRLKAETRITQAIPVVLGLLPPHLSKKAIEGVVEYGGLYDEFSNRVYLVREAIARDRVQAESVLAHELTHALDAQNLGRDRTRFASPLSDARGAERAVREGSAQITEYRYDVRYLGDPGPVSRRLEFAPALPSHSQLARLAQIELDFVYRFGSRFVLALRQRGGNRLVDRALRDPPRTTAAVLDPRRWPARDRAHPPAPLPPHALGAGFVRAAGGDFGALDTAELLAGTGPPPVVDRLTRHWEGGRISLWRRAGARFDPSAPSRRTTAVVIGWRFARPADAAAARAAVTAYLAGAFRAVPADGGTWRLPDGAAAYAGRGALAGLALAPTPGLARAAARAAARP